MECVLEQVGLLVHMIFSYRPFAPKTFVSDNAVTLDGLHDRANPLCCALHPEDSVLATGGANAQLALSLWGGALAPTPSAAEAVVQKAVRLTCPAPVICVDFAKEQRGKKFAVVAAG